MTRVSAEAYLREMLAPLRTARPGEPLPGVPFSCEAVANAFVFLGLLPERRAEEILAEYRRGLGARGLPAGVMTGELSVRPGAAGFQDAWAAGRDDLRRIPLAVVTGPVPIAIGGMDLGLTWATLTPGGVRLHFRATGPDDGRMSDTGPGDGRRSESHPRGRAMMPAHQFGEVIRTELSVTDNIGRKYQLRLVRGRATHAPGRPGQRVQWWDGEMLAEPEPGAAEPATGSAVRWLEFATASGPPARVLIPPPANVATGTAEPPWPTPAEGYLAVLASVTSTSIEVDGGKVDLDAAQIVAAVADALLWVGALPPDSALLSGGTNAGGERSGWREQLVQLWGRDARKRARADEPDRAGLAVRLSLRQGTAVVESIAAHGDLVSVNLYGYPWVTSEYWPMITPCFHVRAVDDMGVEHEGVRGSGEGSPEGSWEFFFWPPVAPKATKIRVSVGTLWEAAWAEIDIPGRPA